uniref:Uncharacterized protein n=1 Tax=Schistosoma curassoni TaxID=6186 RepID=A0A183KQH5_9TREM
MVNKLLDVFSTKKHLLGFQLDLNQLNLYVLARQHNDFFQMHSLIEIAGLVKKLYVFFLVSYYRM